MKFDELCLKDNLIFISFPKGAMGYKLARILAQSPDVYWYSSLANGLTPDKSWQNTGLKSISHCPEFKTVPNHFNRTTHQGVLPPLFSKLDYYWETGDSYYENVFTPTFIEAGGLEIKEHIIYPVHDYPYQIKTLFPNADIISISYDDDDVSSIADHYIKSVAPMPGMFHYRMYRPDYKTEYINQLLALKEIKKDFTFYDKWEWFSYGILSGSHQKEYRDSIEFYIRHSKIKFDHDSTKRIIVPYKQLLSSYNYLISNLGLNK